MDTRKELKELAEAVLELACAVENLHPSAQSVSALRYAENAGAAAALLINRLQEPTPADGAGEGADAGAAGGEAA